jgi:hypothetical protein
MNFFSGQDGIRNFSSGLQGIGSRNYEKQFTLDAKTKLQWAIFCFLLKEILKTTEAQIQR